MDSVKFLNRDIVLERIREGRRTTPCTAGRKLIVISERGEVLPCEILGKSFGNVRNVNYNVRALLKSPSAIAIKSGIAKRQCNCTFENAIQNTVAYSPSLYPRLLKKIVKVALGKETATRLDSV